MKKHLFVFSILASLATAACHTSSKTSTTQTLAATQPALERAPAAPATVDSAITPMDMKKAFVKKKNNSMMQQVPMSVEEKRKMLRPEDPTPTKKQ